MSRCNCLPTIVNPPSDPVLPCADCLQVASLIVPCISSIGPCAEEGEVDLAAVNDYTVCECPVIYQVISVGAGLTNVSISAEGILSFTSDALNAVPNEYVVIKYRVVCPCESGTKTTLSGIGQVSVCIKDLCMYVTCNTGCDPCTGECE